MGKWTVVYTPQAKKDADKVRSSPLAAKVKAMLAKLAEDPYHPPFETLVGDLRGAYSRRINIQHRLVYQVLDDQHVVKVLRMWTHYGGKRWRDIECC